ncbi:serine/threonine-protein kinase PpkA [Plasticicumulans lactativorans]|uniref:non-specific serine/threonine protein kinase n=1 Tax=Plasticicumulans lactativorans TaxID=1133106 RepID=A0A4R2LFT7_9GAMM|nr:serine/threonine-protein kinase [Plasticicumulans lactativorans]TCO83694.1 serine/threonine-protein kinase PpkA [Plasticicumulans lactativorans]
MSIEIPGYTIEGELGAGAMASVYLATQRSLERQVALKVMAASLAADADYCARFLREGKMLAKLSHPNTMAIFDIGNVGPLYYMAMEYIPGGTLKERIGTGLPPAEALRILRQIAAALGYAHARGFVHRDVKPANILFRADGSAVLSDFGIAKNLGEGTALTQAGFTVGTPNYMSPEQAQGRPLDGRSDLYSLGVVLYEMLTGERPYKSDDSFATALMHVTAPIPQLAGELARFQDLINRLLAKSPDDRFPDAAALLAYEVPESVALPPGDSDATAVTAAPTATTAPAAATGVVPGAATAAAPVEAATVALPTGGAAATALAPAADAATAVAATVVAPVASPLPSSTADVLDVIAAAPPPPPPPAGERGRRRATLGDGGGQAPSRAPLVLGGGLLALALAGGTWFALRPAPGPEAGKPTVVTPTPPVDGKPVSPPVATTPPANPPPATTPTTPTTPPPAVTATSPETPPAPLPAVAVVTPPAVETPPATSPAVSTPPPEVAPATTGGAERPLLLPGKKTLFQRVVLGPDARLYRAPGRDAATPLPAFSVYYVYERRRDGAQEWLRVGAASDGRSEGWIDAGKAYDWKQTLVLKFMDRSGRDPVMFVDDRAPLEQVVGDADPASVVRAWLAKVRAAQGRTVPGVPVVAVEPVDTAIAADRFYLLPIFDQAEAYTTDGQPVTLLKVASVDPGSAAPTTTVAANAPVAVGGDERAFKTGIVFVMDTTLSMDPYIDRARAIIRSTYERLKRERLLDKVAVGLVGYRNSTARTPGLEYVTRTFADFQDGLDPARLLAKADAMTATRVSSHSFNEDAFAGVMAAVEGFDWSGYGGRVVLLVTDAGALRKNDPAGQTAMNEAEVRAAADGRHVRLFVLHLKTAAGARAHNHESAAAQYHTLAADPNPRIGDLYVPVEGGDVQAFGEAVDGIVSSFVDVVRDVAGNRPLPPPPDLNQVQGSLAAKTAALGYAMRMDFLGHSKGVRPPSVVTAWVADRDLAHPDVPAFQVCVLLTKLQLNDLQQSLKLIVDAARRTQKSPKDFFQEIASASATMSRDPSRLGRQEVRNLAASGLLGEFLEGLPYRSKVLGMTQELWLSWSVAEQEDFIDELESKIRLYETFHNDASNWVRFGNAGDADALYRVPLSTLP